MIEAMFAMLLLSAVVVGASQRAGIFDAVTSSDKSAVAQQQRTVASQIAEAELERLRGLDQQVIINQSRQIRRSGFTFRLENTAVPADAEFEGGPRAATCESAAYLVPGAKKWNVGVSVIAQPPTSPDGRWADGEAAPITLNSVVPAPSNGGAFQNGFVLVYAQD